MYVLELFCYIEIKLKQEWMKIDIVLQIYALGWKLRRMWMSSSLKYSPTKRIPILLNTDELYLDIGESREAILFWDDNL